MTRSLLALAFGALIFTTARAQPVSFDPATLDALFDRPAKVEVNLTGPLLRMAAMGTEDDPETNAMLRGLRGITVRVYDLAAASAGLDARLGAFGDRLTAGGWQTLVRVRPDADDSDDVWIYVRTAGDVFDGMTVMSLDREDGEASFVFVDGPIDPAQIGRLGDSFGFDVGDDMEDAADDARDAAEDARDAAEDARDEMEDARQELDEARREAAAARAEAQAARDEAARIRAGVRP